jgi:hypothetical protein
MKCYGLLAALVFLSGIPAPAQDTGGTVDNAASYRLFGRSCCRSLGQSLQGVWADSIALPGGAFAPFGINIFHADGSHLGINRDPSHSAHVGVWQRVGERKFVFSTTFFTHDDKGVLNGIVRARGTLYLSADLKSYDGTVERVIMDTSGKELQVIPGIKTHSVRVDLDMPKDQPPQ